MLAGDKIIPEMHLRQCGFKYSDCRPFIKNKRKNIKFQIVRYSLCVYQNKLGKAFFQVLHNKVFYIAKSPKYDGCKREIASLNDNCFFYKKCSGGAIKSKIMSSQLLHKPIIKKFEKHKLYSSSKENIWGADLVDMHLINKYNKRS